MTTVAPAEELLTNPASIYSFTFHVFACVYTLENSCLGFEVLANFSKGLNVNTGCILDV